jgi:hypothetical protein
LGKDNVGFDQGVAFVIEAVKRINIDHHTGWAVKTGEIVGKEFLG